MLERAKNLKYLQHQGYGDIMNKTIVVIGVIVAILGTLQIALSFVYFPRTLSLAIQVPKSLRIAEENFLVPPSATKNATYLLNAGDNVSILVSVRSIGEEVIDFSVGDGLSNYISRPQTSGVYNLIWKVPVNASYNFVFDNGFSLNASKSVRFQLTKELKAVEYKEFTLAVPILPPVYRYLGVILTIVGVGFIAFEIAKSQTVLQKGGAYQIGS